MPVKEIEVKILEINQPALLKRLKKIGAKKVFDGQVEAFYFDFPDGRLKKSKKILRLRQKGGCGELVLKSIRTVKRAKIMDEYETPVPEVKAVKEILTGAGFRVVKHIKKHRVTYAVKGYHLEIDRYPGIPPFLEIEARSLRDLGSMVKKLGYSDRDARPWSVFDVLKYYGKG